MMMVLPLPSSLLFLGLLNHGLLPSFQSQVNAVQAFELRSLGDAEVYLALEDLTGLIVWLVQLEANADRR